MSLAAGSKLGTHEVGAPLGAGGMGEVYRPREKKIWNGDVLCAVDGGCSGRRDAP
jgi:hypothetical protein